MAWLMNTRISVEDHPLTQWSQESIDAIKQSNAEIVSRYSGLPRSHPDYIKPGNSPVGIPKRRPESKRVFIVKEMGASLPDAIAETVVNERIRKVIEDLEPGKHQFFPMLVELPDGSVSEDYFNLQVCHRVAAIDFERSKGLRIYQPQPEAYPDWFYYRELSRGESDIVVQKQFIAGKAIWFDAKFGRTFLSEELGQRFIDEGIRALCLPNDELGRSMHVSEV